MNRIVFQRLIQLFFAVICALPILGQPIQLHPQNPHYFLYKGKSTVLISSGEHYGAVINTDFNYTTYLSTLGRDGLTLTRLFAGAYIENTEAFGISHNTLAPAPNKLLVPWARSNEPGYSNGGNKFTLDKWDTAYFTRIKNVVQAAAEHTIIVELTLFSSYYWDGQYQMSPLHFRNNITVTDSVPFTEIQTTTNTRYWKYQEAYVRKLVRELNSFDNIYYEIQNEPWSDNADSMLVVTDYYTANDLKDAGQTWKRKVEIAKQRSLEWQHKIAGVINDEEKNLPKKHLISEDISNFMYPLKEFTKNVSVINFHYALPQAVTDNYHWNKPIAFNETGFATQDHEVYRRQAWRFILSGGAVFNNLDYSFGVGYENGTNTDFPSHSSGGQQLRKELRILSTLMHSLPLTDMKPGNTFIVAAPGIVTHSMYAAGKGVYLVYIEGNGKTALTLNLPTAAYSIEWYNTKTGNIDKKENSRHKGGKIVIQSPGIVQDIALLIRKQ